MNYCKPKQVGTKEYGKMLKRLRFLKRVESPRNSKIEGQKKQDYKGKIQETVE